MDVKIMANINQIINKAKKHLRKYEYDEVIKCCDQILDKNPRSAFGLRFKAISYYQTGKHKESLEYYYKLYEMFSDDNDAKYSIATLNEKLGNYDEALHFYDIMIKSEPIHSKRKRLLTKMERYDKIIEEYDSQLHEIRNTASLTNIKRRIVLLEEKAIFQYRNKEIDNALNTLREVIPVYHSIQGEITHKKEMDTWYDMIDNCITLSSNANEFFEKFLNLEENRQGWINKIEYKFSDYADRLVFADLLLELEPENVELLEIVAKSSRYIDVDYALDCWKRILELEPENVQAINTILDILSTKYAKDKQLELIDKKLYIEDIRSKLLVRKIGILESMSLYDEAIEAYDEYLKIEKEDGLINHPLTVFDKLRCMEQEALELYLAKQLDESYSILKTVSQIYPTIERNYSRIRNDEWLLDDWYKQVLLKAVDKSNGDSKIFFEEFYKINEESLSYWTQKINFLTSWQHFGNPVTYCNILQYRSEDKTKTLMVKALVYYRTRRLNKALTVYNRVLDLEANNDEAKNYKFNILVQKEEYKNAYKLLKSMNIKYQLIRLELNKLAKEFMDNEEYSKAMDCYNIIIKEDFNYTNVDNIKILLEKMGDAKSLKRCKYHMDWINTIKSMYEPDVCPECGGKLIPIIYGLPSNKLLEDIKNGEEYILGGCCIDYDSPTDYCKSCDKGLKIGPYGIEVSEDDPELYNYCQSKINIIPGMIESSPKKTVKQLEKKALNYGITGEELEALLEKFEEIGLIKREQNVPKILRRARRGTKKRKHLSKIEKILLEDSRNI